MCGIALADIEPQDGDTVERAIASIIREADVEEIKYIMMCFHTGCDLKNRGLKLSKKIDERKKDLICAFEATEAECNVLIKSNDKWEITEQLCSVRSEYALSVLNLILKEMHDEYSARDCAARPRKLSIHSGGIEHACRRR